MMHVRRPSPFSELVTLHQAMVEQVKPRQIRIQPVTSGEAMTIEAGSTAGEPQPRVEG